MKKILLICAMAMAAIAGNAQTEKTYDDEQEIYFVAERMPEFPGGQARLFRYIYETMQYPMLEVAQRHQGRTICQFVVEKDGSISNVEVVRSSGYEALDTEAVRIVNQMPKWNPGGIVKDGELLARRIKYTMPVNFKLEPIVVQPQYAGGADAQQAYLEKNMKYPKDAKKALKEGTAICQFMVAEDGSIEEPEVFVSTGDEQMDKEALRLISNMPKWTPGTSDDKPQKMSAAMFVTFSLPAEYINKQIKISVVANAEAEGRTVVGTLPIPACREKVAGEISFRVLIGQDGHVISIRNSESQGQMITNAEIVELTRKAAQKAVFSEAKEESVGTITYTFK